LRLHIVNKTSERSKKSIQPQIYDTHRRCHEKVERNRPEPDIELIRRAYFFSALHHRGQKRASGEPYLVHPLEVADILADMRLDETSVSTGLLHDVVEDTLVDIDTIREYFGDEITRLVDGLTKMRTSAIFRKKNNRLKTSAKWFWQ
jgi:(p)ppGpp synthase/HD superfamily hydrolase